MINKVFDLKETIFRKKNTSNHGCYIDPSTSSLIRVMRQITGTCSIVESQTGKSTRLARNYCMCPPRESRQNRAELSDSLPESVDISYLSKLALKSRTNESFYQKIDAELTYALLSNSKGRNLEAFMMIYRIFEAILYSFPLIYTSRSKSFAQSYDSLKSYLGNKDTGEFKFLKKFISTSLHDTDFTQLSFDIPFNSDDEQQNSINFKTYKLYFDRELKSSITNIDEEKSISLTYLGIYEAVITLRNRYFHFSQGSSHVNIETRVISDPDKFFEPIITPPSIGSLYCSWKLQFST